MKYRIFVLAPNLNDGTSWWRVMQPFAALRRFMDERGEALQLNIWRGGSDESPSWPDMVGNDCLFIQRPHTPTALKLCKMAREIGLKVWSEHDDDLINIPISNKAYKVYSAPETRDAIGKVVAYSDVVTVSTEQLAQVLRPLNKNVVVIPNGYPDEMYVRPDLNRPDSKLIIWRGSRTHDEDILSHIDVMVKLAEENPKWRWLFFGEPYFVVHQRMPKGRAMIMESLPIPSYFKVIAAQKPEIGIVPLQDNLFNRAKSNIGWQELSTCGAAVVGPDWEEWRHPGINTYEGPDGFYEAMSTLMNDFAFRRESAEKGIKTFEEKFLLSKVTDLRYGILKQLSQW